MTVEIDTQVQIVVLGHPFYEACSSGG